MTGRISLRLTDPFSKIAKDINEAIAIEANKRVKKNLPKVRGTLRRFVRAWVERQPEIASLSSDGEPDSLNAEFGLLPGMGELAVSQIIDAVSNSINIIFKPYNNKLGGSVEIQIQPTDFQNILNIPAGTVITKRGISLDWLEWLLTRGDSIIIIGYSYTPEGGGRSGGGTMSSGGAFRVDPRYSGTTENNFVTRAFDHPARQKDISRLFQSLFD